MSVRLSLTIIESVILRGDTTVTNSCVRYRTGWRAWRDLAHAIIGK